MFGYQVDLLNNDHKGIEGDRLLWIRLMRGKVFVDNTPYMYDCGSVKKMWQYMDELLWKKIRRRFPDAAGNPNQD